MRLHRTCGLLEEQLDELVARVADLLYSTNPGTSL